jgi:hypothetical protein
MADATERVGVVIVERSGSTRSALRRSIRRSSLEGSMERILVNCPVNSKKRHTGALAESSLGSPPIPALVACAQGGITLGPERISVHLALCPAAT